MHEKPGSTPQSAPHPSPPEVLPSSQASGAATTPSPQTGAGAPEGHPVSRSATHTKAKNLKANLDDERGSAARCYGWLTVTTGDVHVSQSLEVAASPRGLSAETLIT